MLNPTSSWYSAKGVLDFHGYDFSEHSCGFRPGRSADMAIGPACGYVEAGYIHDVDIELSKFLDGSTTTGR